MSSQLPSELAAVVEALAANREAAERLTEGLDEATGIRRPSPDAWSVAECLDHLAATNRDYLGAMRDAAAQARRGRRLRKGVARPGLIGAWFIRSLEPPVKKWTRSKAAAHIRPSASQSLASAHEAYRLSQDEVVRFIEENADLDLAGTRFVNPLARGVRFSVATGIHVIPAHERRHLWQANNVKQALA